MRTVRVLVAVVLAASFVMLSPATASAATSCADLSFLTTEQKTALGIFDGQCITKSVGQTDYQAVTDWLGVPGELREMKVAPGGTAVVSTAATIAATVAPQWGKIAGLIGTGLTAVATAGVTLFGGGIGDWWWQPDAPAVEQIPGSPGTAVPVTSAQASSPVHPVADPIAATVTSPYLYGVTVNYATTTAGTVYASVLTFPEGVTPPTASAAKALFDNFNGGVWTNQPYSTMRTQLTNAGYTTGNYATGIQSVTALSGGRRTLNLTGQFLQPGQVGAGYRYGLVIIGTTATQLYKANYSVIVVDYAALTNPAPEVPGSALPGRTIEQTVSCKRPNGTTYTYTNTADASAAITPGALVPVAGLMCDTGDRAQTATATVKSPSKPDVQIISPTAVPSRNPVTNSTTWVTNETVTVVGDPDGVVTTLPGPGPVIEPTTPTGSCSLGWGDVLNGSILFDAVSCALSWAFVPSAAATVTATSTVTSAWNASGVGQLLTSVKNSAGVVWGTFTQSTGCGGIAFTVPFDGMDFQTEVLDSCVEPTKTMADWSRNILTVVIVLGGGLMVINTFLGAFGWPQLFRRGSDES